MSSEPIREESKIHPEGARIDYVAGLWDLPEEPTGAPILLAHGAGLPMRSEFMESMALGLATGGHPVLRFNYPYAQIMELGGSRRPPDRREPLLATHRKALAVLTERFPDPRPIMAGKSMGG
ncbi:MAG: putative alpha/beta-hydrolase family hydrolase, partial [Planctomycetota bacterium]